MPAASAPPQPPYAEPRNAPNWYGALALYHREVLRFVKIASQTVLAPVVTTLLFLAVFHLAIGGDGRQAGGVPFLAFLAPGLVMMAVAQNAFANTSTSIFISKIQGNVVDILLPPLGPGALTLAFALSGVTRGAIVAASGALAVAPFVPMAPLHPWAVGYFGAMGALMLALLGILAGIWSVKFDHINGINAFVIVPLTILSGTFYSIARLPEGLQGAALANPFFYMIDGFRYGFIGQADGPLAVGAVVLAASNGALWLACMAVLRSGYRLKT